MTRVISVISVLIIMVLIAGCGETFNGAVKDTKRIGKGIKTVFVRD